MRLSSLAFLNVAVLVAASCCLAAPPAAPTFQELMQPERYAEPQGGMVVESAEVDGQVIRVQTTGATIEMDTSSGEIRFAQRIGHERPVAALRLGCPLEGGELTHRGPGLARVTFRKPDLAVRINGDSLCMLHAKQPLTVAVDRKIDIAWHSSYLNNHLMADEWGGFGLYCSQRDLDDEFDPYQPTVASVPLPADAVLWLGVCPPKEYDWERSITDNVIWHWTRGDAYPADDVLQSWKPHGNIVLLQSEVKLWKDWNLDFVPREGAEEFARVRRTLHDKGMRFIVYTSPYYFLRGTSLESRAFNSFEGFTSWPPGTPTGENMGLFLPAIRRVMSEYKPDGLYFDGQYIDNPAALYALARSAREIVGEEGILEWHSTHALGHKECYLPQADAYVDFILRGEGRGGRYADFDYMRYFVSGYNLSNSIGVVCNNGPPGMSRELARTVLRANARFHTLAGWVRNETAMQILDEEYKRKLTPALRETVDREVDRRQAEVAEKGAALQAEREALARPARFGEPAYTLGLDKLPQGKRHVSAVNGEAISVGDGVLQIRAHAHTFAYISIPLHHLERVQAFEVKIRQGSDGGQSWGPAAMLRWAGGSGIRLGTRSGGELQADVLGDQQHGSRHEPSKWIWLRARWLSKSGVVERSTDGVTFERVWTFKQGEALHGPPTELLIGKVPYNGQPRDNSVVGDIGECEIGEVRVFGK